VNAYGPTQAANPDLKWEQTATTDIGIDAGLFKGRANVSVDVYNKNTSGMIFPYTVDRFLVSTGTIVANGGGMNNKGIELQLTATPVSRGDFSWTTSLNLAHNINKITSLNNPLFAGVDSIPVADPEGGGESGVHLQVLKAGRPLGQYFTLQYAGKNANGTTQFINHNGKPDTTYTIGADYHYLGNAQPKLIYGWNNTVRYRRWDLTVFFRGVLGDRLFNATRADLFRPATAATVNILKDAAGESPGDANVFRYSSRFIENGSFLRLDHASLGYTFNHYIHNIRAYATVNNLFTLTGYKGIDPEINQGGVAPGVDYNNFYPKTRTVLLGLNVSF
jgi:iron complex outermembrane receptor protein